MKISTNMIKKFVGEISNEQLYELTNNYIIEVESLTPLVNTTGLVVGYVKESEKLPGSDHLSICKVDVKDEVKQIVCGAGNVKAGQYVIVALEGTLLPGNFLIKPTTIRGVDSNGMICSLEELGFDEKNIADEYKDGIYYFKTPQEIGSDALKALNLDQATLELGITPNRSDLLSVLGFSYDLGAVLNKKIKYIEPEVIESDKENPLKVTIEDNGCKRYYARYLDNIKVGSSPDWLKADLLASGIRPINNVVDITNYVLLELGTPLHAFDALKFGSNEIVVKRAKNLSEVITLDEERRTLKKEDITITNGSEVKAIGGVMGLLNSEIDDNTTTVILEAAWFEPSRIKKTAKRLNLESDSSVRFEKGVDELRVLTALNKAAEMMQQIAGARVYRNVSFAGEPFDRPTLITLEPNDVNKLLGTSFTKLEVKDILKRLNIIETKPNIYLIPNYRKDLKIKEDLVEEVGRIYGFNNLETNLPSITNMGKRTKEQTLTSLIRNHFIHLGFNEVINYSLIKESDVYLFKEKEEKIVSVLQPMSEDKKSLRQSLINGLVNNVNYHLKRQQENVAFLEIGRTYYENKEINNLGLIIQGEFISGNHLTDKVESNFFSLKGILKTLENLLDIDFRYEKIKNIKGMHPGVLAKIVINDEEIGLIGQIHPNILKDSYALELNLDLLIKNTNLKVDYQPVSKYPSITRDISLIIDKTVLNDKITNIIKQTGRKELINIELFDYYLDEKLAENLVSLAYRLTFNSSEKTLLKEDIDKIIRSIHIRLERELGAKIKQ